MQCREEGAAHMTMPQKAQQEKRPAYSLWRKAQHWRRKEGEQKER